MKDKTLGLQNQSQSFEPEFNIGFMTKKEKKEYEEKCEEGFTHTEMVLGFLIILKDM